MPHTLKNKPHAASTFAVMAQGQRDDTGLDYRHIIRENLLHIIERYEQNRDYPWIDTKFNVLTGENYPDSDLIRGRKAVYGWIQGRALESLAGHALWLRDNNDIPNAAQIYQRIGRILRPLLNTVRLTRERNKGHLYFLMSPDGHPLGLNADGTPYPLNLTADAPTTYTDIFVAKGMYAAAACLNDRTLLEETGSYCYELLSDTLKGGILNDQLLFDKHNPAKWSAHYKTPSACMLQIGTAILLMQQEQSPRALNLGLQLIQHILHTYVNLDNRWPQLEPFDYVEYLDDAGEPAAIDNAIISDPGHALEYVGLAAKLISHAKCLFPLHEEQTNALRQVELQLFEIYQQNYLNGYQKTVKGICKTYDLRGRKIINAAMPWWSPLEALRAAYLLHAATSDKIHLIFLDQAIRECHNSLLNYLSPHVYSFAIPCRDGEGRPANIIPAMPDVDPGYHTGLVLIDCLSCKPCPREGITLTHPDSYKTCPRENIILSHRDWIQAVRAGDKNVPVPQHWMSFFNGDTARKLTPPEYHYHPLWLYDVGNGYPVQPMGAVELDKMLAFNRYTGRCLACLGPGANQAFGHGGPGEFFCRVIERNENGIIAEYETGVKTRIQFHPHFYHTYGHLVAAISDLDKISWPDASDPARYKGFSHDAAYLRQAGEYVVASLNGFFSGLHYFFMDYENTLLGLMDNPQLIDACLERLGTWNLEAAAQLMHYGADGIALCDDLGSQHSMLMSPAQYRRFFKPWHKRLCACVHDLGGTVHLHTHGAIMPVLDDFVECGFDFINPFDPMEGFDLEYILSRYARHFVVVGGLPTNFWDLSFEQQELCLTKVIGLGRKYGGFMLMDSGGVPEYVTAEQFQRLTKLSRQLRGVGADSDFV